MQVCTSLQTDNHASTPLLSFFTGRMPFLPPNQQRQSTEGTYNINKLKKHKDEKQKRVLSKIMQTYSAEERSRQCYE